jgi:putative flippase GtrA
MFKNILKSKSLRELFRTYLVGAVNLIFGLVFSYFLQFYLLAFLRFPTRTYITNVIAFFLGVVLAYFLSRKYIFKLDLIGGTLKEFFRFLLISLINLLVPILVWYLINLFNQNLQQNEIAFLLITILIHGSILPIKYLIYKFFVFKDSL